MENQACPETSRTNPVKAIRLKCLDCSGGSTSEVENCPIESCALYPFRFGKNPFRSKVELSEDRRIKLAEQLRRGRSVKADHAQSLTQQELL